MKIATRHMFIFSIVISVFVFSSCLSAQAEKRGPSLRASVAGENKSLILKTLKVEARIHGSIAETRMTMTFFNPYSRVLEGELTFPLPEGAFVSGYALDINGVMVDGVIVEKKKARVVFEKIVRQGIDPGLVEWVKGNNFKTRIFPIRPRGSRTVSVSYVSETDSAGGRHLFRLPIGFKRTVDSFSLRVEVVKPGQAPTVASGAPANFSFRRWNNSYTAESTLRNYTLNSDPVIHLPGKVKQSVQVERGSDGNHYFSVTLPESATGLQSNRTKRGKHTGLPRRIAIYWDSSGSMGRLGSDRQRELSLLRSYFARFKGQTVTVRL
ncbi:MAG: hypothetical protein GY940_19420, partial [bacterium]|nr:hypothetical protein [bacterium]